MVEAGDSRRLHHNSKSQPFATGFFSSAWPVSGNFGLAMLAHGALGASRPALHCALPAATSPPSTRCKTLACFDGDVRHQVGIGDGAPVDKRAGLTGENNRH